MAGMSEISKFLLKYTLPACYLHSKSECTKTMDVFDRLRVL